ncbi:alpha/beta hydrolase [Candidatus Peregrinibacteria bacterium]|nr:alpha/beta hydrolase [Candidatus Peregrinibacteria bacterium]
MKGVVIFAHGSGSSRFSPRNNFVAEVLRNNGLGTLLFDLMTEEEDAIYKNRFNIPMLAERLKLITDWFFRNFEDKNVGYFGSSTGAAAALIAAGDMGNKIKAVVSRGGRPDLAMDVLENVKAPTLLIVGGADYGVIELNEKAYKKLKSKKKLSIVPNATHLFEEPGALEEVADRAAEWFKNELL